MRLGWDGFLPDEVLIQFCQRVNRYDFQVWYERRFGGIDRGNEDPFVFLLPGHSSHGQHPAYMSDAAIQRKLTHNQRVLKTIRRQLAVSQQDTERDGQVV